jgi:hypothetical protein
MKPRFKPDDVVSYVFEDRLCEGVIDECTRDEVFPRALRIIHDPNDDEWDASWEFYDDDSRSCPMYESAVETMLLHPDPDPVWASYCAALISGDFDDE